MKQTVKFTKHFPLLPIYLGIGIGAGFSIYFGYRARRRRNSLLARTRRQADDLARQMAGASSAAGELLEKGREEIERQKKGLLNAVEAGKKAYQRSVA